MGDVLLDQGTRAEGGPLRRWLVARDAFDLADGPTGSAIHQVECPSL